MAWNHPADAKKTAVNVQRRQRSWKRVLMLALFAVLCIAVTLFLVFSSTEDLQERSTASKTATLIASVAPAPSKVVLIETNCTSSVKEDDESDIPMRFRKKRVYKPSFFKQTTRLLDGTVITNKPSKATFTDRCENALVVVSQPCGSVIPLTMLWLPYSEKQIMEMLRKPVEIKGDDSEQDKANKARVADLKENILAYMDEGHSLSEAIAEIDLQIRSERESRKEQFLADHQKRVQEFVVAAGGDLSEMHADEADDAGCAGSAEKSASPNYDNSATKEEEDEK